MSFRHSQLANRLLSEQEKLLNLYYQNPSSLIDFLSPHVGREAEPMAQEQQQHHITPSPPPVPPSTPVQSPSRNEFSVGSSSSLVPVTLEMANLHKRENDQFLDRISGVCDRLERMCTEIGKPSSSSNLPAQKSLPVPINATTSVSPLNPESQTFVPLGSPMEFPPLPLPESPTPRFLDLQTCKVITATPRNQCSRNQVCHNHANLPRKAPGGGGQHHVGRGQTERKPLLPRNVQHLMEPRRNSMPHTGEMPSALLNIVANAVVANQNTFTGPCGGSTQLEPNNREDVMHSRDVRQGSHSPDFAARTAAVARRLSFQPESLDFEPHHVEHKQKSGAAAATKPISLPVNPARNSPFLFSPEETNSIVEKTMENLNELKNFGNLPIDTFNHKLNQAKEHFSQVKKQQQQQAANGNGHVYLPRGSFDNGKHFRLPDQVFNRDHFGGDMPPPPPPTRTRTFSQTVSNQMPISSSIPTSTTISSNSSRPINNGAGHYVMNPDMNRRSSFQTSNPLLVKPPVCCSPSKLTPPNVEQARRGSVPPGFWDPPETNPFYHFRFLNCSNLADSPEFAPSAEEPLMFPDPDLDFLNTPTEDLSPPLYPATKQRSLTPDSEYFKDVMGLDDGSSYRSLEHESRSSSADTCRAPSTSISPPTEPKFVNGGSGFGYIVPSEQYSFKSDAADVANKPTSGQLIRAGQVINSEIVSYSQPKKSYPMRMPLGGASTSTQTETIPKIEEPSNSTSASSSAASTPASTPRPLMSSYEPVRATDSATQAAFVLSQMNIAANAALAAANALNAVAPSSPAAQFGQLYGMNMLSPVASPLYALNNGALTSATDNQYALLQQACQIVNQNMIASQLMTQMMFNSRVGSSSSHNNSPTASNSLNMFGHVALRPEARSFVDSREDDLEKKAKEHREAASKKDTSVTTFELTNFDVQPPVEATYSTKIFLGGVPWDMDNEEMIEVFRPFGACSIQRPGKDVRLARTSQGLEKAGYLYLIVDNDASVNRLLTVCRQQFCASGYKYFYNLVSRRSKKEKSVQVIPWNMADSSLRLALEVKQDDSRTVFLGALHGMMTAKSIAITLQQKFGPVELVSLDVDKYKYPTGSGKAIFVARDSYMKAIRAGFVKVTSERFEKTIQIDQFVSDMPCSYCTTPKGPVLCKNCDKYYCKSCWNATHHTEEMIEHDVLMKTKHNNAK